MINPITPIASNYVSAIQPLQSIGAVQQNNQVQEIQQEANGVSFAGMLKNLIDNVNVTAAQTRQDSVNLALGLVDEEYLHNIAINAEKADLALKTMVSVRNKVMEAYTEIMRINV